MDSCVPGGHCGGRRFVASFSRASPSSPVVQSGSGHATVGPWHIMSLDLILEAFSNHRDLRVLLFSASDKKLRLWEEK